MSYRHKYELDKLIVEGAAKTFQGREIDTGRPVFVHLLTGIQDYAILEAFLRKVEWLHSNTHLDGAARIVEVGEDAASPYVVTEVLESFVGLEYWVDMQCAQVSEEATSHWKRQIDECLAASDFQGAFEAAREAVTEFPDNPELQRAEEIIKLLSRGLELCGEGRDEKGLEFLWQAYKMEAENPHVRAVMVNTLLERAYSLIDSDWRAADELIQAVLRLDPNHESARTLSQRINPEREEFVAWCIAQAEELQTQGEVEQAHSVIEQGLSVDPDDARLNELHDILPGQPVKSRQPPEKAPSKVQTSSRPAEAKKEPLLSPILKQILLVVLTLFRKLGPALALIGKGCSSMGEGLSQRLKPLFGRINTFLRKKLPWSGGILDKFAAVRRRVPWKPVAVGLAAALALIAVWWAVWSRISEPAKPTIALHSVTIRSSPPGASISINNDVCGQAICQLELEAGSYQAEAQLAGYRPAAATFRVGEQGSAGTAPIDLTLVPLPAVIRLSSDLAQAKVSLDGEPAGQLEEGEFELELEALEPGEHTLSVSDRGATATITFEMEPGALPIVRSPIETRELKAVVIAGFGPSAYVHGGAGGAQTALNGESLGALGGEGLALTNLTEGSHEIKLGEGRAQETLVFESVPNPTLAAFLKSDRNVGGLRIATGEDDVRVYLNGKKYRRATRRGQLLAYLSPNTYKVRVEKEGYESPPEQLAEIRKGEQVRLEFSLIPKPQTAVLVIRNGVPGAEVWLNNTSLGSVHPDGSFSSSSITEGTHTISLQKDNYKLKRVQREFLAGATVELDGALETTLGILQVELTPPDVDARLTLRREGETVERAISDRRLQLTEGTYTVTASAPGYEGYAATVRVLSSETKTARLILTPKVKQEVSVVGLKHWEDNGGWQRNGDSLVRRGGNFVLAPVEPRPGVYEFTAGIERGRRLEWVVNYQDDNNYELFQIGKDYFHRIQVSGGKKSKPVKVRHPLGREDFFRIRIEVAPDSITHRVLQNGEWTVIDRWSHTNAGFTKGKFGFHIAKRDEIALADFRFVPGS